jgi:hypothetical protein
MCVHMRTHTCSLLAMANVNHSTSLYWSMALDLQVYLVTYFQHSAAQVQGPPYVHRAARAPGRVARHM